VPRLVGQTAEAERPQGALTKTKMMQANCGIETRYCSRTRRISGCRARSKRTPRPSDRQGRVLAVGLRDRSEIKRKGEFVIGAARGAPYNQSDESIEEVTLAGLRKQAVPCPVVVKTFNMTFRSRQSFRASFLGICVGLLIAGLTAAASGPGVAFGERQAIACGSPSRLDQNHRAPAGPVRFALYTDPNLPLPTRAQSVFIDGYPSKVVVLRNRHWRARRTILRGVDCSTGTALRFWYREGLPFKTLPVSKEQLETTGTLTQVFPVDLRALHGYMLFTEAGRWKISVSQKGRRVGVVVVQVTLQTS
jgi:hypothetical protein